MQTSSLVEVIIKNQDSLTDNFQPVLRIRFKCILIATIFIPIIY